MVLLSLLVFIFSIAISFSDGCVTIGSFEPRPACQCSSRELSVNDLYYDLERHPFAKTAISFANDRALWAGGFGDCWQSLSCKTEYNNHTIVIFDPTTAIMTSSASINATCDPYSQTWDIVGSGLRARRLWAMCVNFDFPVFTTRASPAADCDCANYLTTPSDVREHTIHYKDYHRLIAHSNVTNITRTQSYNGCVRRHDCNIEDGKTLLLFHNDQVYQSSSGDFQFECPDYTWSVSENWVRKPTTFISQNQQKGMTEKPKHSEYFLRLMKTRQEMQKKLTAKNGSNKSVQQYLRKLPPSTSKEVTIIPVKMKPDDNSVYISKELSDRTDTKLPKVSTKEVEKFGEQSDDEERHERSHIASDFNQKTPQSTHATSNHRKRIFIGRTGAKQQHVSKKATESELPYNIDVSTSNTTNATEALKLLKRPLLLPSKDPRSSKMPRLDLNQHQFRCKQYIVHSQFTCTQIEKTFKCRVGTSTESEDLDDYYFDAMPDGKAPHFPQQPVARQNDDGSLELECFVDANPTPQVKWYYDNKEVENSGRFSANLANKGSDSYSAILTIKELADADAGAYRCAIVNPHGKGNANFNLKLTGFSSPTFVEKPQISSRDDGQVMVMEFRAKSILEPTFVWQKLVGGGAEEIIANSDRIKAVKKLEAGNVYYSALEIKEPTKDKDAGQFICTVKNESGKLTATFTVKFEVPEGAPSFTRKPQILQQTSAGGEPAICFDIGYSARMNPQVTWISPKSKKMKESSRIKFKTNDEGNGNFTAQLELTNYKAKDSGTYTCNIKNDAGEANVELTLNIEGPLDDYADDSEN